MEEGRGGLGRAVRQLLSRYYSLEFGRLRRAVFGCALWDDFGALEELCATVLQSPCRRRLLGSVGSREQFFRLCSTLRDAADSFGTLLAAAASVHATDFAHRFLLELAKVPDLSDSPLDVRDSLGRTLLHRAVQGTALGVAAPEAANMTRFLLSLAPHLAAARDSAGRTSLELAKDAELFQSCVVQAGLQERQPGLEALHAATRMRLLVAEERAMALAQRESGRVASVDSARRGEAPWNPQRPGFRIEKERRLRAFAARSSAAVAAAFNPRGHPLSVGLLGGAGARAAPLFRLDGESGRYIENCDLLGSLPLDGPVDEFKSGLLLPVEWIRQRQEDEAAAAAAAAAAEEEEAAAAAAAARAAAASLSAKPPSESDQATLAWAQLSREERRRQRHEAVRRSRAVRELREPASAAPCSRAAAAAAAAAAATAASAAATTATATATATAAAASASGAADVNAGYWAARAAAQERLASQDPILAYLKRRANE